MTSSKPRLISRAELANRLSVSVRTLENYEHHGIGPQPRRIGPTGRTVRYLEDEVEEFIVTLKESA